MRSWAATHADVAVIPTGSISLDVALGVGGLPRGRVVEIYGPASSGKTTLCLHIIAQAQQSGGFAAFVDVEHALHPTCAARCGVDINSLYISQPDTGEQALEIVEALVRGGAMDVIVVDSVAALVPRAEIEGEMGDHHVGLQARLISQALRRLSVAIKQSRVVMVFTNQLRFRSGIVLGNPETTSGGLALRFYSSVRLDIRSVQTIRRDDQAIGNRTRAKVKKNKVAPLFRVTEFDIMFNEGISREGDILDLATQLELVEKQHSCYILDETRLGRGREDAKACLRDNPELCWDLENRTREVAGLPTLTG
jgi:recombination protein RecA